MNLDKDKDRKCKTEVSEKSLGEGGADTTFLTTAKTAETRFRRRGLRVKTKTTPKAAGDRCDAQTDMGSFSKHFWMSEPASIKS